VLSGKKQEAMMQKVLILGASGAFGSSAAAAFWNAGWTVELYRHGTDMTAAAKGADVIINGLSPPVNGDGGRLIRELSTQVLAAAKATGARVILPGHVDVYGMARAPWGPGTPHRPVTRAGTIRAETEALYRAAQVRTCVLRAGDFMHEEQPHLVMNRIVLSGLKRGRVTAPGHPAALRTYAYLPDLAQAAVGLAARGDDLPVFADIPFAGHTFSIAGLAQQLSHMLDRPLRTVPFAWWPIRGLSPFNAQARAFSETRYLHSHPHWMEATTLAGYLPDLRLTSFEVMLSRHLMAMGLQGRTRSTQTSLWREAA
jgi:nucleoside-diphosphate-sugar epimerase